MNSLELFAGCGGLAYGIAEAGFKHQGIIEIDRNACSTIALNKDRGVKHVADWPLIQSDIRQIHYADVANSYIDLVSGGPPCQPFSIGGSHKGPEDARNMWPEVIRCIKEVQPKGFVFENVKGLLRPAFKDYLDYIVLQLSYPLHVIEDRETEAKHLKRLRLNRKTGLRPFYTVIVHDINAADYGASQKRNRALIMGVRSEISNGFTFPEKTHSREALIWHKYETGEYWDKHEVARNQRAKISVVEQKILDKLKAFGAPIEHPWVTVRDIISDLPCPRKQSTSIANHEYHAGARIYPGHTGSVFDEPAKALKAGAHGVPGGENILVHPNGRVRYFTIREMARLQGLPDEYHISGAWINSIKQLGNAVPVEVGIFFGRKIYDIIDSNSKRNSVRLGLRR